MIPSQKLPPIPADLALKAVRELAAAADVELVLPGAPEREAVLLAMAAVHALDGSGWSLDYAREHVSVTLPGAGAALDLMAMIPVAGPILASVAGRFRRTSVHLSPSALRDGVTLLGTWQHEAGHVGDIRNGGLMWCVAYGIVPNVRAGAEAPCYASDMAHQVALAGASVDKVEAGALGALSNYGLDDAAMRLARALVHSNAETLRAGEDPGGIVADSLAALRAVGWQG